jgi:hypothetical protein
MTRLTALVFAAALLLPAVARAQAADPQYAEAKRLFDALDYESAVRALDVAIAGLEARPPQDAARRELLPNAYEMRARSKFGLGDQAGARADFVALLKADAGHVLTGSVSPRVVSLFEEAVKQTVTTLSLSVTPSTAKVEIDGVPIAPGASIPITVGDHVVAADQLGYRKAQQAVTAAAGAPASVTLALERVGSVLNILTAPAGVSVAIDGVARGKTTAGPPPASFADSIARVHADAAQVSSVMVVADVPTGSHVVEFTRDCYVKAETRLPIDKPDDYTVGPIVLQHAVASLSVKSSDPSAQVVVDGQARGTAPFSAAELCEGEHTVELRSATGRFFKRVQARPGDTIAIDGVVKPAFALVSSTGQAAGGPDMRTVVERLLDPAQGVTVFAPQADQAEQALKASQLPAGWLALDANKRPVGPGTELVQPMRREGGAKLASALGAQGVGSVTVLDRNRVVVALLAAGSSDPDVVEIAIDNPDSIRRAIAQLDRVPAFFRPSIGLGAIDVADAPGAVVVSVEANGPSGKAGIRPGDIVTKANGEPVADASALAAVLASRKANDDLALEVKDRTGAVKRADVKVAMTPRVIGIADQTLAANAILVALRARLAGQTDPAEEAVLRLNLAAALTRVEAWSDARAELQRVKLPEGGGVGAGTVEYLLGVCAERLGSRAEAETAFKAAAASDSLLTEDGPPVKELAQGRLAELQRRGSPQQE